MSAPGQPAAEGEPGPPANVPTHDPAPRRDPAKVLHMLKGDEAAEEEKPAEEEAANPVEGAAEKAEEAKPEETEEKEKKPADEEPEKTEAEKTDEQRKAEREERRKKSEAWAEIRRMRAAQAKKERDYKRKVEDLTKREADLSKVQTRMSELNDLMTRDPAEFVRQITGGSGNLRGLLERVLKDKNGGQQDGHVDNAVLSRFEKELEARDARLKELQERLDKQDEEARRREEERDQKRAETQIRENIRQHLGSVDRADYPLTFRYDAEDVADYVFQLGKQYAEQGTDIDLVTALDHIEDKLQAQLDRLTGGRSPAPPAAPPAQDNGAVEESRRTPGEGQIGNAAVAERASADRPMSREERFRRAASLIRQR